MPANLSELRALMREHGIAALIVGTEDAHNSEYVADCDARRAFVSGFTGSAGTALVTLDHALLWTDGRYWLQVSFTARFAALALCVRSCTWRTFFN
jgi:Xaa-Pro aminopeptidase